MRTTTPCGCPSCSQGEVFMCRMIDPITKVLNDHLGVRSSGEAISRRHDLVFALRETFSPADHLRHTKTYSIWCTFDGKPVRWDSEEHRLIAGLREADRLNELYPDGTAGCTDFFAAETTVVVRRVRP